ncbi:MAG: fibrillarin-like rRNA/tRNA 2'-O-methyltransferase [archaeon]|nr:fibrillarin-like rRNA/tRNA 2'-O-methyltransferase [archaeon]
MARLKPHPKFEGVFLLQQADQQKIFTKNLDAGKAIYEEWLFFEKDEEYREWNPYRSKLGAIIKKKVRNIYFTKKSRVLYLGASSGTTVSHVSDIVNEGIVFAVEFAPRSIRELVQNCENRKNVISIMGDANLPEKYAKFIFGEIDLLYEDVAQPNQTEIAILNAKCFLKSGGILIITIKARSISTSTKPSEIYPQELKKLEDAGFEILEKMDIKPYTADHLIVIARYFED